MSSTAGSAAKAPAPWKSAFLKHLSKMDSPEFVLATLQSTPAGSPTPYIPRARYCIFRGMWAELPENKHNEAPKNERVFESEMPTFTTDVRMEKVGQLFGSSAGHAEREEQTKGSGGGGPVEAVWWIKETGTQWRIKGKAFVVAEDIEGEGEESSGVRTVKSEVGKRMRVVMPGKEDQWSWKTELVGHFGNNSPGIRGSFRNPPPGQPKDKPYNDKEEEVGSKTNDLNDPVARKNFRVAIIVPEEVEELDLSPSDPTKAHRFRHTFNEDKTEWSTIELWP